MEQCLFLPVANEHQHYLLQIMDAEPEGKDRSLGTAAINVADILRKMKKDIIWDMTDPMKSSNSPYYLILRKLVLFSTLSHSFLLFQLTLCLNCTTSKPTKRVEGTRRKKGKIC